MADSDRKDQVTVRLPVEIVCRIASHLPVGVLLSLKLDQSLYKHIFIDRFGDRPSDRRFCWSSRYLFHSAISKYTIPKKCADERLRPGFHYRTFGLKGPKDDFISYTGLCRFFPENTIMDCLFRSARAPIDGRKIRIIPASQLLKEANADHYAAHKHCCFDDARLKKYKYVSRDVIMYLYNKAQIECGLQFFEHFAKISGKLV